MSSRRRKPTALGLALGGRIVAWLLRSLGATWRLRCEPPEPLPPGEPCVGALWHRGLFIAAYAFRDRGVVVPVSQSRDGERIAAVLARLGFGPSPRGSSSRGAVRLLASLVRLARRGHTLGVLCDGPRGPSGQPKPGVLGVARGAGLPVRPVGLAARPALRFGSWDRVILPLPFARVHCRVGPPLRIPRDASRQELEALRLQLEQAIDREQEGAETAAGRAAPRRTTEGS